MPDIQAENEAGIVDRLRELKEKIISRAIKPAEMRGFTITLSNYGAIAGRYASPVVLPPTVAIMGAGKSRDEVVVRDGQMVVRRILPLALTFDHRVVTGGEAARFLSAVIEDLQG
jgi:pyruvate dehydrogenase E2 component (dihydrolipoamide acetyltransferase)